MHCTFCLPRGIQELNLNVIFSVKLDTVMAKRNFVSLRFRLYDQRQRNEMMISRGKRRVRDSCD